MCIYRFDGGDNRKIYKLNNMRYKALVSRKLDELNNIVLGLSSLLSHNPTREQIENQIEKHKSKLEEIQTLINAEQEA